MKNTIEMFISFFKVGLFTFGGGYAMIPIAQKELVDRRGWLTEEELMDYYGISQVSMGAIAINTNALIGYHIDNKRGALLAAIATALPSILIIMFIAAVLGNFFDLPLVANMFRAIRIVVCALIVHTTYQLMKNGLIDLFGWILFIVVLIGVIVFQVNPFFLVVPSGILGLIFYPSQEKSK